jgi:hypothetical protein
LTGSSLPRTPESTIYQDRDEGVYENNYLKQSHVFSHRVRDFYSAHVAQSVEHFLGKEEVIGSNPIVGSRDKVG